MLVKNFEFTHSNCYQINSLLSFSLRNNNLAFWKIQNLFFDMLLQHYERMQHFLLQQNFFSKKLRSHGARRTVIIEVHFMQLAYTQYLLSCTNPVYSSFVLSQVDICSRLGVFSCFTFVKLTLKRNIKCFFFEKSNV